MHYLRTVYECPQCRGSYAPLDEELGVESKERFSRGVKRKVMYVDAHESFGEASRSLETLADIKVSKAECERIALKEGARRDVEQRAEEAKWLEPVVVGQEMPQPEISPKSLVIQADAATVLAVAGEEHKSVYCGVAFDAEDRHVDEGGRPYVARKRYTASAVDMEDFGPRLKALAWRMGLRTAERVAFVADGAPCLWNWARDYLPSNMDVTPIQDFWHVAQHVYQLSADVLGSNEQGRTWAESQVEAIKQGNVAEVIAELERMQKRRRGKKRARIGQEIRYLTNGRERMNYPQYREDGWPIGSGAAEAACKNLIKARFGITGAHWRRANIPMVLALRLDLLNHDDFAADPSASTALAA